MRNRRRGRPRTESCIIAALKPCQISCHKKGRTCQKRPTAIASGFHGIDFKAIISTVRHYQCLANRIERENKDPKTESKHLLVGNFLQLVNLAYRNIRKKWTQPLQNWGQTAQQLAIRFGDRFVII